MKKTAVAIVLVLGLGTGGALGLFSLLDAIALQKLPVPRPDELIAARPVETTPVGSDLPYPSSASFERLATLPGLFTAAAGVGPIAPETRLTNLSGEDLVLAIGNAVRVRTRRAHEADERARGIERNIV
jgi:hypothetical protein